MSDRALSSSSPGRGSDGSPSDAATSQVGFSSLNVFKNLAERRNAREGAQPKKRGPKPDTKPALTRRQELNRQAQRTHRERKELYVKALEDEILRLKNAFTAAENEKQKQAEENSRLKSLLAQHGIAAPVPDAGGSSDTTMSNAPESCATISPEMASQSPAASISPSSAVSRQAPSGQQLQSLTQNASVQKGVDYNQAGIDFVLTLERPCMEHLPLMVSEESNPVPIQAHGHALMVSCPMKPWKGKLPPPSTLTSTSAQIPWEVNTAELCRLLDLSPKHNDGEVTPIMAWGMLVAHPRFLDLDLPDLQALAAELSRRIRCYGFGAVTEEFEVLDAIEDAVSQKPRLAAPIESAA